MTDPTPDQLLRTVRFLLGRTSFTDQRNILSHLDYVLTGLHDCPLQADLSAIRSIILANS